MITIHPHWDFVDYDPPSMPPDAKSFSYMQIFLHRDVIHIGSSGGGELGSISAFMGVFISSYILSLT